MLIGYLVGWLGAFTFVGYNEYLLLLPVVMAMLPDFDVVLYALPRGVRRRFRGIRHRGTSHTLVFLGAGALVVAYIFNVVAGIPLLAGFVLALLGGLSHVLLDAMTSFAFPYLGPFSWKERSLDLDGAVTWYMVPFSLFSILAMWGMRAYAVPFQTYTMFVTFVFSVIGLHYLARLSVKLYVERVLYKGRGARVNPTSSLLSFYVVLRSRVRGSTVVEYFHTSLLGRGQAPARRYFELERPAESGAAPPGNVQEAVLASSRALAQNGITDLSSMAAMQLPSKVGEWSLFWFDWNSWRPVGPTPGVAVTVAPGSAPSAVPASHRISW
ncbi:MAG: metal-dependent hydrolase [Euryarchaeota archaeon]|nr:metal-dependent hydrolase [Euryarchaeota archaeon]